MLSQKISDGKPIPIYDIAKEAGVSPATVSRVLTNSANVRSEKKIKIQALIDKYEFKPNTLARGLADTKTRTIGILSADIRNPYYASMFIACEQAARAAGYTAVLCNFLGEQETEAKLLKSLHDQKVEAIIQFGGRVDDLVSDEEYVELVNRIMATTPMVITGKLDGTRCHVVRIDSMQAMDILMEHLLALGHERIALVGGRRDVLSTFEKYQRYKQILKEHGLPFDPQIVPDGGSYDVDTAYRQMSGLLEAGVRMTAVIAINDFSAMGIIKCLKERGYRIPEDISVVSYDNTYMTEIAIPPLTSVDYNYEEYGKTLMDTAIGLIEGRKVSSVQMVRPTLVERGSSGICKHV